MNKLILIRHGDSIWNDPKENRFAGWVDVPLTKRGEEEARKAGERLKAEGFVFDLGFTSYLQRAYRTLDIILKTMELSEIEVRKSWRLNERHYGALQGLNKSEMAKKYGEEQVKTWRRGYDVVIPPLEKDNPMYPGNDPLYKELSSEEIPASENLKDVVKRVVPYWEGEIMPSLKNGKKIIISASGNSLRALVKHISQMDEKEIVDFIIPTAIPLQYEFDENFNPISRKFLASDDELREAIEKVNNQGKVKG